MTRGQRPLKAIVEAKGFAERMGYRWQDNSQEDLAYDFLIFKSDSIRLVKVRQSRYRINPESFYEDLFPDEIRALRELPFPKPIVRELWFRTQHERVWRRLMIHDISVGEIEWWGPDGYVTPHAR
jgi:hypothetical protein